MNVVKYDIKKILECNRFCGMARYPFDGDPCAQYYSDRGSSCYDMYILGHLLSYLRLQITTRENILHTLYDKKFMAIGGDFDCFYAHFNPGTNMLKIGGEYADFMDQAYFESVFPEEKSKKFLEYQYQISLDTFLDLAEKMKKFFDERAEWIILYEDKFGKIQLEQYYRQDEPQPSQEE